MLAIIIGILISAIDFFVAIFFVRKAINKEWNTFYRFLIYSMLLRLFFILLTVALIIVLTELDKFVFLISLFVSIFIFKLIEIFYIHFKIKYVNLQ